MTITTLRPRSRSETASAATGVVALGLAAMGVMLPGGAARAQAVTGGATTLPVGAPSVLPATGTDVRVGDLRSQVSSLLRSGPLPGAGTNWIVTPSLGVDVGFTDNALQVSSPRRADFFTVVTPSIAITGDTARLKVNASYSPTITAFAQTSGRTRVDQYLTGDALATVVPDLFYVDLRSFITQSSITGGYGPYGNTSLNGQDQVQTLSVAVTPYLVHRFDGWGTGTLSYSFAYTTQSDYGSGSAITNTPSSAPFSSSDPYQGGGVRSAFLGNQDLITNRELAQFSSGENLGRTNLTGTVSLEQFSGGGVYSGAYRNLYTIDGAYALNRSIALVGEIGYESLRYAGVSPIQVESPVYQAGVRWTPKPDSSITVTYGRRDGLDSVFVDGSYAPTARTRIYASYSTGLTSSAEDQQNLLQGATFTGGYVTSAQTGAPLVSTNNAFGTQNAIYELRRLTVTAVLLEPRDTFSLGVTHEDRKVVGGGVLVGNGGYGGTYGQFGWQHDLRPGVSTGVFLQYGTNTTQLVVPAGSTVGVSSDEQFVTASAGVNYALSASLTGRATYLLNSRFGSGVSTRNYLENIVLVGLRKVF